MSQDFHMRAGRGVSGDYYSNIFPCRPVNKSRIYHRDAKWDYFFPIIIIIIIIVVVVVVV